MVRPDRLEARVRPALRPRSRPGSRGRWARYYLGRVLQVAGLVVSLVAATAFFGTPSTTAMLKMLFCGVALFVPGYLLARPDPRR